MTNVFRATVAWLIVVAVHLGARADLPNTLSYQAFLTDSAGLAINQTTSITFSLYTQDSGGTARWTETLSVAVDQGLMSVELGAGATPFPADLFDQPLWLGVSVAGDPEMTPRRAVSAGAFAFRAGNADKLGGVPAQDVLDFAGSGIPPGNRIAVLAVNATGLIVDPMAIGMVVDGRSFHIQYPPLSPPQWAPLFIEYTYPLGSPSPLGLTAGSALSFDDFDILVADDEGYGVQFSGTDVVTSSFTTSLVEPAGGGPTQVVERVGLSGNLDLSNPTAPAADGPLEVNIILTGSDTFLASGRGPLLSEITNPGPGQGGPAQSIVVIEGIGPREFDLVQMDYAVSDQIGLTMRLSGVPLPAASDCKLFSVSGLSPVVLDDGGTPVDSVRFEELRFSCANLNP